MPKQRKSLRDPFADREASNYTHPVPSRELIIEHLSKRSKPVNFSRLLKEFNLDTPEEREGLRRRMRAMVRDRQLMQYRRRS